MTPNRVTGPGRADRRPAAGNVRQARIARVRTIRRRVIAGSLALFVATWMFITLMLVTGHDPVLARQRSTTLAATAGASTTAAAKTTAATTTTPVTTSASGTAGLSSTGTSSSTTSSSTPAVSSATPSSAAAGTGSSGVSAVTSSQS